MYRGQYEHTMDAKGRVIIPGKFREALGESFVITRGLDGCLWVMDESNWSALEEILTGIPSLLEEGAAFKRYLMGSACDCEPDKNGRMMIPTMLRTAAGLGKEVVFSGLGNRIEVWDKARYEEITGSVDMKAIAKALMERGFSI